MTLSELLAAVYDECNYASSPAATVTTRITRLLNEGLRVVFGEPGLARLLDSDDPLSVASVASQARYVVPEAVAKITGMRETTNDRTLDAMSLPAYRREEPDPASVTGTPTHYVPIGRVAVATQPADASALFVKSTSASDGASVTAYLEGLTTGGYRRVVSAAMNGTTAVQVDATVSTFIEIEDFYLSANAAGTVTLLEDSGTGTELARITIGQKRPRYYAYYLWPTPAAVVTYLIDYRRELVELANAADEPPIPTEFHPLLVAYAVAREFETKGDSDRSTQAMQRVVLMMKRLKYYTQTLSDELPVLGRGGVRGHSRLGGWFPADTWR